MLVARTPGGVWLSWFLVVAAACGDDAATDGAGGATGGASSSTSSTAPGTSTSTQASSSASSGGGTGAGGNGGSGGGDQGGGDQGGGGRGGEGGGGEGGGGASSTGTGGAGGAGGGGGAGPGGGGGQGGGEGGGEPQGERLRIIAANLTSGNLQSYDPGHGKRILEGLAGDVLLVQELRTGNNSAAALRSFADVVCGTTCDIAREPIEDAGDLPNGIVSRHPIVASGFWNDPEVGNREFFWARIDLPGPQDLVAISVHFLTSSAPDREAEAEALLEAMGAEVLPEDLVVLGGDFNTDDREEAVVATLSRAFVTAGPYPVDTEGIEGTSQNRSKPYDWVLGDDDLHARSISVQIGGQSFPSGLVVDTRTFDPIADLAPALTSDSGATNMQHMAVVRDFALVVE